METERKTLLWLNVVGGVAVLGSYAACLAANPDGAGEFWGGVPDALRPVYTVNMFLAAAGYFAFSYFVFFRLDPASARVGEHFGFRAFHALYALILIPSALWMPLTFAMIESPSTALWVATRIVLALVGVGSLGLLLALWKVRATDSEGSRRVALVGCAAFCLQTAVLDALVWPAYFPV